MQLQQLQVLRVLSSRESLHARFMIVLVADHNSLIWQDKYQSSIKIIEDLKMHFQLSVPMMWCFEHLPCLWVRLKPMRWSWIKIFHIVPNHRMSQHTARSQAIISHLAISSSQSSVKVCNESNMQATAGRNMTPLKLVRSHKAPFEHDCEAPFWPTWMSSIQTTAFRALWLWTLNVVSEETGTHFILLRVQLSF